MGWDLDSTFTFSESFDYKYIPLIHCLGEHPNYFDCDFTIEDLIKIEEFFNFVHKQDSLDGSIFLMTNVVNQIKYIDFMKDALIDKYHDLNLVKINNILTTSMKIQSNKVKIISPDVDERIGFTKYISNNYLGLRSTYIPKLKFGSEEKIKREI